MIQKGRRPTRCHCDTYKHDSEEDDLTIGGTKFLYDNYVPTSYITG